VPVENSVSSQMPSNGKELKTNFPRSCWKLRDTGIHPRQTVAIGGLKRKGTPEAAHFIPDNHGYRRGSGCAPVVAVMEAAHLRHSHDSPLVRWLYRARLR
jgi:hypothetical protein